MFSEKIENVYILLIHKKLSEQNSKQDCKPGYVWNDHLSRTAVTSRLKRPT